MPGIAHRVGSLLIAGLLTALAGCGGGGKSETSSDGRTVAPPTSGPGSVAWEAGLAGRTSPALTETPFVRLESLSPDRSVLFATRGTTSYSNSFPKGERFLALDSRTGAVLWSAEEVQSYAVSDDAVFLASRPSTANDFFTITARDLRSGSVRWTRQIPAYGLLAFFRSGPVVAGLFRVSPERHDQHFRPSATFRLLALDRGNGTERWQVERSAATNGIGATRLPGERIHLISFEPQQRGTSSGLDAASGAVLWADSELGRGGVMVGGSAVYSVPTDVQRRFDPATGNLIWERPAFPVIPGRTLVAPDDTIYHIQEAQVPGETTIATRIRATDPATGETRWDATPPPSPAAIRPDFSLNARSIDSAVGVGEAGNVYYVERFLYTRTNDSAAQYRLTSLASENGGVRWNLPLFNGNGPYNYDLTGKTLVGPNGLVYGRRGLNIVAVRTPDTQ